MLTADCVRSSAAFVASNAKNVFINAAIIPSCASKIIENMQREGYSAKKWRQDNPLHPQIQDASTVDWIFVMDLLNFSFWPEVSHEEFIVTYKGEEYTGYWSLCALIRRALDEGFSITDPKWYSEVDESTLKHIFRSDSDTPIPMLSERILLLKEAGKILVSKFDGSFCNVVRMANKSAVAFMNLLVFNFHSFFDLSTLGGEAIYILKRAQILVADLWACFEGESFGNFNDIDFITAFADYRIPQQLQALGVISFSDELSQKIKDDHLFCVHEKDIIEIRSSSIHAIEMIRKEICKFGEETNSILIDFFLWDLSKRLDNSSFPIHKTRSCFY